LVNLSPRKVQDILERSSSVQANRIFLFLGRYYDHQWVNRIDETRIKLGAGKRQVVEKGRFDERYQITVPEILSVKKGEQHNG
ncbi:type IV toxin-antitoxin system AbiEi family antitoxin domain-containing protein, partial [Escherichia coli]|nr:type IV toxin-antitoxin system AbiEi family antitoxin domain-containing protein [Escherichia coli]